MSGLAAGVRSALAGQRVCLVEQHALIGGLNSYYRRLGRSWDVALHALTNYNERSFSDRRSPLNRVFRQLRLGGDQWQLRPQRTSRIVFPDVQLRFGNDFEVLCEEVRNQFGKVEASGLRDLAEALPDYDRYAEPGLQVPARPEVARFVHDPLLIEMLFCPLLFYGGPTEHDITFAQFAVLFRSVFLEGLARPREGIRVILRSLVRQFRRFGGELRTRTRVKQLIVRRGRVERVVFADGSEACARRVISSAGYLETMRMCEPAIAVQQPNTARMAFAEAIVLLDRPVAELGGDDSIVFFNRDHRFAYRQPEGLIDDRSGTVCFPDRFDYDEPSDTRVVRLSCLANYRAWARLERCQYIQAKTQIVECLAATAAPIVGDLRPWTTAVECFTPLTIERFTGHDGGAIYGGADKRLDGSTPVSNLFICGNDQGLVGVVGTLLSGIGIANRLLFAEDERAQRPAEVR